MAGEDVAQARLDLGAPVQHPTVESEQAAVVGKPRGRFRGAPLVPAVLKLDGTPLGFPCRSRPVAPPRAQFLRPSSFSSVELPAWVKKAAGPIVERRIFFQHPQSDRRFWFQRISHGPSALGFFQHPLPGRRFCFSRGALGNARMEQR